MNGLNIAAYEGFLSLAQVLHDIIQQNSTITNAGDVSFEAPHMNDLVQHFRNRTFALKSGNVYLNGVSHRRVNVRFMRFSNTSLNYEVSWCDLSGQYTCMTCIGRVRRIPTSVWQSDIVFRQTLTSRCLIRFYRRAGPTRLQLIIWWRARPLPIHGLLQLVLRKINPSAVFVAKDVTNSVYQVSIIAVGRSKIRQLVGLPCVF